MPFNSEWISIILFLIGLYGLIARRRIVKTIISLGIMEVAVILYFLSLNRQPGLLPPIGDVDPALMADPLPQALMITAIVIGVAITAVTLTLFIALYHRYGTTDWEKARVMQLKERADD